MQDTFKSDQHKLLPSYKCLNNRHVMVDRYE